MTFIGPNLKLLRSVSDPERVLPPVASAGATALLGGGATIGVLRDGTYVLDFFVARQTAPAWLTGGLEAIRGHLVHTRSDGRFIDAHVDIRSHEAWCRWGAESIAVPYCSYFVTSNQFAHGVAEIRGDSSAPGGDRYHLLAIDLVRGDTVVNRMLKFVPVTIPASVVDSVRRLNVGQRNLSPADKAVEAAVPFAKHFPPASEVLLGADGTIWIHESAVSESHQRWQVVDRRGNLVGALTMPAGVKIMDVRRDRAWGTLSDADGAQSVVRFSIH